MDRHHLFYLYYCPQLGRKINLLDQRQEHRMSNLFEVISPVDQSFYCERQFADGGQVEKTLAKAAVAQVQWQKTTLAERIDLCRRALQYFLEHADEIGEELTWQMGRPISYTPFEIKKGFKERAQYMMSIAESSLQDITIENSDAFLRKIKRVPLGTVLVLAPWNYPYLTSINVILPALLAGNTVILKHAQQTPLCAERYAAAFDFAGLPEGVFQYLHIDHETVAAVVRDPRIDYVAFTGSVEGGRAIQTAVSSRFLHAGLELGGKDPAYVKADAPLNFAVENLVDGAFFNSGQSCCGIERIYVEEPVFKDFVEGFVALTYQYRLDNPLLPGTTLGPVVRPSAARHIQSHIDEAISLGAQALIDYKKFPNHGHKETYLAPQVLINVHHGMKLMSEETFGPVVGIMPVKNDEQAIQWMNDSVYGLTASIWSSDMDEAQAIADQVNTGTCFLNRCDYLDPALAWTGVKNSGKGCTLSSLGYESLTRAKSYHFKNINSHL